jgi:hypothetical protein
MEVSFCYPRLQDPDCPRLDGLAKGCRKDIPDTPSMAAVGRLTAAGAIGNLERFPADGRDAGLSLPRTLAGSGRGLPMKGRRERFDAMNDPPQYPGSNA